jgi:ubiquitin-protein ligase
LNNINGGIEVIAKERRLKADFKIIKEEFKSHPYIKVKPIEGSPPIRYSITYYLKGLKWNKETNRPIESCKHEVEIFLHKDYPREKPLCIINTEIFHPNFSSKICIADHWGIGENIANIIILIGDMIQYKEFNPKSPLNQEASRWAIKNRHLLPVSNISLSKSDFLDSLEIPKNSHLS